MHNAMYDNCQIRFHEDASWLAPYFYCLNALGKSGELVRKYQEVIASKTEEIQDASAAEIDDNYTVEDREERVASLQKERDDIEEAYRRIVQENYRPDVSLRLDYVYGCNLMDCPRHQRID